jgi:hypothetical protein
MSNEHWYYGKQKWWDKIPIPTLKVATSRDEWEENLQRRSESEWFKTISDALVWDSPPEGGQRGGDWTSRIQSMLGTAAQTQPFQFFGQVKDVTDALLPEGYSEANQRIRQYATAPFRNVAEGLLNLSAGKGYTWDVPAWDQILLPGKAQEANVIASELGISESVLAQGVKDDGTININLSPARGEEVFYNRQLGAPNVITDISTKIWAEPVELILDPDKRRTVSIEANRLRREGYERTQEAIPHITYGPEEDENGRPIANNTGLFKEVWRKKNVIHSPDIIGEVSARDLRSGIVNSLSAGPVPQNMAEVGVKIGAEFAAAIPTAGASIVFNPEINAQGGLFYSQEEGLMGDFEAALNTLEFASPPFAAIFGPADAYIKPMWRQWKAARNGMSGTFKSDFHALYNLKAFDPSVDIAEYGTNSVRLRQQMIDMGINDSEADLQTRIIGQISNSTSGDPDFLAGQMRFSRISDGAANSALEESINSVNMFAPQGYLFKVVDPSTDVIPFKHNFDEWIDYVSEIRGTSAQSLLRGRDLTFDADDLFKHLNDRTTKGTNRRNVPKNEAMGRFSGLKISSEELEALGINRLLRDNKGKRISIYDLQQHMDTNRAKIVEFNISDLYSETQFNATLHGPSERQGVILLKLDVPNMSEESAIRKAMSPLAEDRPSRERVGELEYPHGHYGSQYGVNMMDEDLVDGLYGQTRELMEGGAVSHTPIPTSARTNIFVSGRYSVRSVTELENGVEVVKKIFHVEEVQSDMIQKMIGLGKEELSEAITDPMYVSGRGSGANWTPGHPAFWINKTGDSWMSGPLTNLEERTTAGVEKLDMGEYSSAEYLKTEQATPEAITEMRTISGPAYDIYVAPANGSSATDDMVEAQYENIIRAFDEDEILPEGSYTRSETIFSDQVRKETVIRPKDSLGNYDFQGLGNVTVQIIDPAPGKQGVTKAPIIRISTITDRRNPWTDNFNEALGRITDRLLTNRKRGTAEPNRVRWSIDDVIEGNVGTFRIREEAGELLPSGKMTHRDRYKVVEGMHEWGRNYASERAAAVAVLVHLKNTTPETFALPPNFIFSTGNFHIPVLRRLMFHAASEGADKMTISTGQIVLNKYKDEAMPYANMRYGEVDGRKGQLLEATEKLVEDVQHTAGWGTWQNSDTRALIETTEIPIGTDMKTSKELTEYYSTHKVTRLGQQIISEEAGTNPSWEYRLGQHAQLIDDSDLRLLDPDLHEEMVDQVDYFPNKLTSPEHRAEVEESLRLLDVGKLGQVAAEKLGPGGGASSIRQNIIKSENRIKVLEAELIAYQKNPIGDPPVVQSQIDFEKIVIDKLRERLAALDLDRNNLYEDLENVADGMSDFHTRINTAVKQTQKVYLDKGVSRGQVKASDAEITAIEEEIDELRRTVDALTDEQKRLPVEEKAELQYEIDETKEELNDALKNLTNAKKIRGERSTGTVQKFTSGLEIAEMEEEIADLNLNITAEMANLADGSYGPATRNTAGIWVGGPSVDRVQGYIDEWGFKLAEVEKKLSASRQANSDIRLGKPPSDIRIPKIMERVSQNQELLESVDEFTEMGLSGPSVQRETPISVFDLLELGGVPTSRARHGSSKQELLDAIAEIAIENNPKINAKQLEDTVGVSKHLVTMEDRPTDKTVSVHSIRLKDNLLEPSELILSKGFKARPNKGVKAFSTLSESLTNVQMRLFQINGDIPKGGKVLGFTDFNNDGKYWLNFTEAADFQTGIHEIGHVLRRQLSEEQLRIAGEFSMGKEGYDSLVNKNVWTRAGEEKFAEAFETFVMTGYAPNQQVRGVFERFKDMLLNVIRAIKGSPHEESLSPAMKDMFDDILNTKKPSIKTIEANVPAHLIPQAKKFYGYRADDYIVADDGNLGRVAQDRLYKEKDGYPKPTIIYPSEKKPPIYDVLPFKVRASAHVRSIARKYNTTATDAAKAGYATSTQKTLKWEMRVTTADILDYVTGREPRKLSQGPERRLKYWTEKGRGSRLTANTIADKEKEIAVRNQGIVPASVKQNLEELAQTPPERLFRTVDEPEVRPLVEELSSLSTMDTILSTNMINDHYAKFMRMPGLRLILGRLDPSTAATDPLAKSLIAHAMLKAEGDQKAQIAFARLRRLGTQDDVFGATNDNGHLIEGAFEGQELNVNDIRTYPDRYGHLLDDKQKEWIANAQAIEEAKRRMFAVEGIEINDLEFEEGGHYAGRIVMSKIFIDGDIAETVSFPRAGGVGRVGAKSTQEKRRVFETEKEAIAAGYRYLNDDEALSLNLQSAYRRVADKRAVDYIVQNVVWSRTSAAPQELLLRNNVAIERVDAAKKLIDELQRAKRGGQITAQTRKSIETLLPEMEGMLDDVSAISLDQLVKAGRVAADQPIDATPRKGAIKALFNKVKELEVEVATIEASGAEVPSELINRLNKMKRRLGFTKFAVREAYENYAATGDFEYTFSRSARSILMEDKVGAIDELLEMVRGTPYYHIVGENRYTRYRGGFIDTLRADAADVAAEKSLLEEKIKKKHLTEGSLQSKVPAFTGRFFEEDQPTNLGFIQDEGTGEMRRIKGSDVDDIIVKSMVENQEFSKILNSVNTVNSALRFFQLAGDMSLFGIQLLFLMGHASTHPKWLYDTMKGFVHAFIDPTVHAKVIDDNKELLERHPGFLLSTGGTEFTEFTRVLSNAGFVRAKPIKIAADVLGRDPTRIIPTAGKLYMGFLRGAQQGFEASIDIAGIELLKSLDHKAVDAISTQQIDDFTNEFRGLANSSRLGTTAKQRQWESLALLAPRYNRAIVAMLADVGRGGLRGDEARKKLASGIAAISAMAVAFSLARGEDPDEIVEHFIPTSPKFMTWNIEGTNVGFGSKVRSLIKLSASIYTTVQQGEGDKLNDWSMDNPGFRFIRGNLSPIVSTGVDALMGRTYMGEPVWGEGWDIASHAKNFTMTELLPKTMPIWAQAVLLEGGNVQQRGIKGVSEFFGGRGYPESSYQLIQGYAKDIIGVDYEDMEPFERRLLRQHLKDVLGPMMEERIANGDKNAQYWDALNKNDEDRIIDEEALLRQFYNPRKYPQFLIGGANTLREEFARIQNQYAQNRASINETFAMYQDDVEFDSKDPHKFIMQEWYALYDLAKYDESDVFDHDRLERLQRAFWDRKLPDGQSYKDYQDFIYRNTSTAEHPDAYQNLLPKSTVSRWRRAENMQAEFLEKRGNWSKILDNTGR